MVGIAVYPEPRLVTLEAGDLPAGYGGGPGGGDGRASGWCAEGDGRRRGISGAGIGKRSLIHEAVEVNRGIGAGLPMLTPEPPDDAPAVKSGP